MENSNKMAAELVLFEQLVPVLGKLILCWYWTAMSILILGLLYCRYWTAMSILILGLLYCRYWTAMSILILDCCTADIGLP